jgi:hypothetical protein
VSDESADTEGGDPFPIEPDVPRLARIRNAISGGDANFSADRTVVKDLADAAPTGLEGLQAVIEALHRSSPTPGSCTPATTPPPSPTCTA